MAQPALFEVKRISLLFDIMLHFQGPTEQENADQVPAMLSHDCRGPSSIDLRSAGDDSPEFANYLKFSKADTRRR